MTRVAVLGAGKIGQRHLATYESIPDATVAGVVEPDPACLEILNRTRDEPFHRYESLDQVCGDSSVDVVDVCSPTPYHFDQVMQSLEAGKSVFSEKPLVPTVAEIDRITAALDGSDASLRVGYVYRFHPRVERLKQRLDDDVLGPPRLAVLRIGGRGSHRAWKHDRASHGGALLDMASHMVDLAYHLFGTITEVEALTSALLAPKREIDGAPVAVDADDVVVMRLRSATGVEVTVHADFLSPGFANLIEVAGENGSALVSVVSGFPDRYVLRSAAGDVAAGETFEVGADADMLHRELESFISDFGAGRVVRDVESSRLVAKVVEAFEERDRRE